MPTCPDHLAGALLSAGLTLGTLAFFVVGSALGEPVSTGRSGAPNKEEGAAALPLPRPNENVPGVGVSWVLEEDFSARPKWVCPLVTSCFPPSGFGSEIVVSAVVDGNADPTLAGATKGQRDPEKGFRTRSPSGFGAACPSPVAFPTPCVAFSSGDFATPLPSHGDCHFHQSQRFSGCVFETD